MEYKNGKIYKIISDNTNNIYIGSTCQPLNKRIAMHRGDFKKFTEGKKGFITSFDIMKLGSYDIILIENFPCDKKEELHARERYYIEFHKNICVNKYIPNRKQKEYEENNKLCLWFECSKVRNNKT